jgi:hypothetical protein
LATENIRIKYEVDKKQLDASNKSLEQTAKLNNLTQKEVDETNDKFEEQSKAVGGTSKAMSGLGGQLVAVGNKFQIAGKGAGDMAAGLFATTAATNATSKSMKLLKIAIASTGIGLLVVALGAMVNLFTKNQKVADFFTKQMGRLSAVFDALSGLIGDLAPKFKALFNDPKQALLDFGNLIKENFINRFNGLLELIPQLAKAIKLLFQGEFKQSALVANDAVVKLTLGIDDFSGKVSSAFDSAAESVRAFGEEMDSAIAGADQVTALQIKMRQQEIAITEATARRRKEIQDLLIITRDFTVSFAEQQAALAKANELELQNQSDLVAIAQTKLDLANAELETTPKTLQTDEQRLAVAEAQANVYNEQANSTAKQREILNRQNELETRRLSTINAQNAALEKQKGKEQALLDEKMEAEAELSIFLEEQKGNELQAEIERRDLLLANEEEGSARSELIIQQSKANQLEIIRNAEEQAVLAKKEGNEAINNLIKQGLGETKAGAIFAASLDTQAAAIAAFKAVVGIPIVGPVLAPIAAGAATAFGLRGIAKIAGISPPKFEKGGKIGGHLHSSGGTLIEAERDEFVMNRKATSKYGFDLMDKINNLELDPNVLGGGSGGSLNVSIDTSSISKEIKKMPQNMVNINSQGFTSYQRKQNLMVIKKQQRYSI